MWASPFDNSKQPLKLVSPTGQKVGALKVVSLMLFRFSPVKHQGKACPNEWTPDWSCVFVESWPAASAAPPTSKKGPKPTGIFHMGAGFPQMRK